MPEEKKPVAKLEINDMEKKEFAKKKSVRNSYQENARKEDEKGNLANPSGSSDGAGIPKQNK